jgi:hypothetical protein
VPKLADSGAANGRKTRVTHHQLLKLIDRNRMGNLTMCSYGDVGGNMSEQRGRDSGIDRGSGPTFPPGRRMRPIAKVKVI